ncbi:MAG: 50S ribosomal protein L6 [Bacteroidales bacterium]|nr:50S ribosomal protein L6 [Bacteroidales bacterium]
MSRIGTQPVNIPEGVEVNISENNLVTVKGKMGELQQQVHPEITVKQQENQIILERPTSYKSHKALHGLYRSLINSMVIGVSEGFRLDLELVGVGYRAVVENNVMDLTLGFSHHIYFQLPDIIQAEAVTERGKNPVVTLTSPDKQLLGQVAAKIRELRRPEPYKGKGVKFKGEVIRRKAGKSAAST